VYKLWLTLVDESGAKLMLRQTTTTSLMTSRMTSRLLRQVRWGSTVSTLMM